MSIRRVDLEIEHVNEGRARLLSITASRFGEDWMSLPHSHEFTEIFYVKNGRGRMQIEDRVISIRTKDIIIINSLVRHTELSGSHEPLEYYVIGAAGLQIRGRTSSDYSFFPCPASDTAIEQCFENILAETRRKGPGYKDICQHYLEILILHLLRLDNVECQIGQEVRGSRECNRLKQYMDENYHSSLTLDDLARLVSLNKYYLSHRFRQLYGCSPMAYLNQVRIQVSRNLLATTDYSIEEIANMAGFSSHSYFSQTFKKTCHISPQNYRRNEKSVLY